MNMAGHVCAVASSFAFRDGPSYYIGKGLGLASAAVAALMVPLMMLYLTQQNAKKALDKDTPQAIELRLKSVEEVHDRHPDFMYSL